MRATLVSRLINKVVFSFEPEGLLYTSICTFSQVDNNIVLQYSRMDIVYTKCYTTQEAMTTPVFIYDTPKHIFLSQHPESTIFEVEINSKREVLIEKNGTYLKNEFKRLQQDPMYFYLKYCEIRH